MPDLHQQIAELEAEIEELLGAAERCRKFTAAARVAIAAGGLLLLAVMLGLFRREPVTFIAALVAVLGGSILLGSNKSTLEEITATIKAHEARRARLINELGLHIVDRRPEPR